MLVIIKENNYSIPVYRLSGRFDGLGASIFDKGPGNPEADYKHSVFDFAEVEFLSSAGIRSLMKLEKILRSRKGFMILTGLSSNLEAVLEMAGLLNQFRITKSLSEAVQAAESAESAENSLKYVVLNEKEYSIKQVNGKKCFIETWGLSGNTGEGQTHKDNFEAASLSELNIALGIGGFGISAEQASGAAGEFVSGGCFAGIVPADGYCEPDFIISDKPDETVIYTSGATGFSGEPAMYLEVKSSCRFRLDELIKDMFNVSTEENESCPVLGIVIFTGKTMLSSSYLKTEEDIISGKYTDREKSDTGGTMIFGLAGNESAINSEKSSELLNLAKKIKNHSLNNGFFLYASGIALSEPVKNINNPNVYEAIKSAAHLENFVNVFHINPDTEISGCSAWIFKPAGVRPASEKRIKIEVENNVEFREEWEIITRRIYSDSSRVVLSPLLGGFSSLTFTVTSYDTEGRRQLPTVLKIGSIDLTRREVESCIKYAEKYILNNCAKIMGTAEYGDFGGLRYNFVGITGSDSRLSQLTDHYKSRPVEELLPLFDRIFTDIMKPWYGQPKWETVCPYNEQNPFNIFSDILSDAEKQFGISAENENIDCPELGINLPNPFHFLKYEYDKRKNKSWQWYTGINHGDLNMQNILLDEIENIYVIDFSETKPRNIICDFSRLEPIFKFEMTKLEDENDLKELLEFEEGLAGASSLQDIPAFIYNGSDPMVEKAHKLICRMRSYADRVTLFEKDIVPYMIAILEWTYPVVSYYGFPELRKKLAVYSAAFIVRKILELDGRK